MRLISLQLCNFRQFYSKTPVIKFACGRQNTTIIHGNNGAGKTAILNAFTWVLYEQYTAAFAVPENLINKRAIAESIIGKAVECWVELQFERDRKRYQLKRKCYGIKHQHQEIEYSQSKLFILVSNDDGKWYTPLETATDIIEQILPASLHQYFFFDGERIDNFFRPSKKNKIAEDTKELLGVKVLDRAIEHLKKAVKSLQDELQIIGDTQTKQLLQKKKQLEADINNSQITTNNILQEIEKLENQKKNLSHQLQDLSGADKLQYLKEKLTKQEKVTKNNLRKCKQELQNLVSKQSYLVFLSRTNETVLQLIDNLRQDGKSYHGLKQDFVQTLLNQQQCICGNSLNPETTAHKKLLELFNQLKVEDTEESIIRLETQIQISNNLLENFWQELDRKQAYINHQYLEITKIEQEIEKLNNQLRIYPDRNIQKIQQDIETIEEKIKELILEQGTIQQKLIDYNKTLATLVKQIDKYELKEKKQILTQKRIQATLEAIKKIIEVRIRLEQQFRDSLEEKVGEIFSSISFTPYIPQLSNNYELTLMEKTSGIAINVPASTGENQILSLSFIGGIIDRVREWSQKNTLMGPDSSTFPIVMDSPFGSLDEIYRRQVAKSIPRLANQLVILVTKTQWRGEVASEVADFTGKQYVLAYNSPKPDCQKDWLQLYGIEYPLVKSSTNQFEYTEIIEVSNEVL